LPRLQWCQARLFERDQNVARNGLNVQIDLTDYALAGAVRVKARKPVTGEESGLHVCGRCIAGRSPEVKRNGREAGDVDIPRDVVAEGCAAVVRLEERLQENHLHGEGRDRGQVKNLDIDLARAIGRVDGIEGDVQGDHVCLSAEHAANGRLAILSKCAQGNASIDDFEGV
jgi:hypothetical protein